MVKCTCLYLSPLGLKAIFPARESIFNWVRDFFFLPLFVAAPLTSPVEWSLLLWEPLPLQLVPPTIILCEAFTLMLVPAILLLWEAFPPCCWPPRRLKGIWFISLVGSVTDGGHGVLPSSFPPLLPSCFFSPLSPISPLRGSYFLFLPCILPLPWCFPLNSAATRQRQQP